MTIRHSGIIAACALALTLTGHAQVSYTGGNYVQNFDLLPSTGTSTTSYPLSGGGPFALNAPPINAGAPDNTDAIAGWSIAKYAGSGGNEVFLAGTGSATNGSTYSFGASASTDRALGSVSSGTVISRFGAVLVNNSGTTITQFTLAYTGEQWRHGGATTANKLTFSYSLGGGDINTGTFANVPALDFIGLNTSTTAGALDGNAAANRTAIAGTVTGLSWAPGQTLVIRWTDVDDPGSDDGLAVDDLTFSTDVGAGAPAVVSTVPANGAVNVAPNTTLTVSFNEQVTATGNWFTLTGSTSGVHSAFITGGPTIFTLTPSAGFNEGETVALTVLASQIADAATGTLHPAADYAAAFTTLVTTPIPIHTVQGSGLASPYAGQTVTVMGIVTAVFPGLGGFYVQAAEADYDNDPTTSEGLFVFNNTFTVAAGDIVKVTGNVAEFGTAPLTETELTGVSNLVQYGTAALPAPVAVSLPFASTTEAEQYEGMRVTLPQTLTVTDNFDLGHFGEFIASNGRLATPTNVVAPGAPAQTLEAANFLNQILVDDGTSATYPDPTPYVADSASRGLTRRAGSTVTGITGILDEKFSAYIIEPTAALSFADSNPRGDPPPVDGTLRICMGNVQNFMNGNGGGLDGAAGGFPTSRGATNLTEYQRQLAKVTAGILALAPDIMGLTEVENDRVTNGLADSYGPTSALAQLVASLNANAPAGTTYAYVDASAVDITTDQIHVALIYRTETVSAVGAAAMLSDPAFNDVARNPLTQTFMDKGSGQKLTVCINHFRAKGSAAAGAGNADSGDGQATNNALRVQEANAVTAWLATDPTGSGDPDFLIVGDLNSYAKEDPIAALEGAGYVDLMNKFEGEGGYSYAFNGEFGHLDHALANAHLAEQVAGAATWHANADELAYYDYNTENKDAAQQAINVGTPYRYADHDPVIVGVRLHPEFAAPVFTLQPLSQTVTAGDSVTFTVVATGYPAPTFQWQKGNGGIGGATATTLMLSPVTAADAGTYSATASNLIGSATSDGATLTVNKAAATVILGNLTQPFDGTPKAVTVTTTPAGLAYAVTYDGSATPPTNVGSYAVVATITDPDHSGSATGTLRIIDTVPPVITSLTARPHVLWPPNHQMVLVTLKAVVSDAADPAPVTRIIAVTSNERGDDRGRGRFLPPDWLITGPLTLMLRAEHSQNGSTRIYTITVESRDHSGNVSTRTVTVTVPREFPHFPDRDHDPRGRPGSH